MSNDAQQQLPEWYTRAPLGLVGLDLQGLHLRDDERLQIAQYMRSLARDTLPWGWGDLLNEIVTATGEKRSQVYDPGGRDSHIFAECAGLAGQTEKTLYNWMEVAAAIPYRERVPDLTWTHHRLVAGLRVEQRRNALNAALKHKWNTRQLEDELVRAGLLPKRNVSAGLPADQQHADLAALRHALDQAEQRIYELELQLQEGPRVQTATSRPVIVADNPPTIDAVAEPAGDRVRVVLDDRALLLELKGAIEQYLLSPEDVAVSKEGVILVEELFAASGWAG